MTILEAIAQVDELVPNAYPRDQKIRWLSRIDGKIKAQILDLHEGESLKALAFRGYGEDAPLNTPLLVDEPYTDVYLLWLEKCIHFYNGEIGRHNNANALFCEAYEEFCREYNRTHLPLQVPMRFLGGTS